MEKQESMAMFISCVDLPEGNSKVTHFFWSSATLEADSTESPVQHILTGILTIR